MSSASDRATAYVRRHQARLLAELREFVRIPSVSAQPRQAAAVKRCAGWLARRLQKAGLDRVRVLPAAGRPIVYGESRRASGRPTVLVYGHYDVQPVDPVSEWQTPPFRASVRDGRLHGRGASDDKGQLFTQVASLEAYLRGASGLPVNVKCLFEGGEEVGSPGLAGFVERNRRALATDVVVMSDTRMRGPNQPALTYSMRGQLGLELEVHGPRHDLHSGNFGGAVHNPLQALCEIIAQLHDQDGHVAIPGFYDQVRLTGARERDFMRRHGPSDGQILRDAETSAGWGETGYSLYERVGIRPALTINGITGGYQGSGGKGVIPASAVAKLSFRLVPGQDPQEVERLFRQHIARITPGSVRSAVRVLLGSRPAVIDRWHPALRAASRAYARVFGRPPVFLRSGGSIPAVSLFHRVLGVPTVLMGYALPSDRIHAPNEHFELANFYKGMETNIEFLDRIGRESWVGPRSRRLPETKRERAAADAAQGV